MGLGSLGLQCRDEVLALTRLHGPALLALVVQEQAVELLEVGHYVVLDVRDGDLQAHAATVKGPGAVAGEHLADHAGYHRDDLKEHRREGQRSLRGF